MERLHPKTAIFILPALSSDWNGAEGIWVSTGGWAAAAKKRFGEAIVITRDRIASADEIYDYPLLENAKGSNQKRIPFKTLVPQILRIIGGDVINWYNSRNWKILEELEFEKGSVAFVWEKHDLFSGRGLKLARELNVPYISYVHAPVVWEASKWGVKRYFWGRILEWKEAKTLRKADFVGVVSEEVKEKLLKMGVPAKKIFISPMAVDPEFFKTSPQEKQELLKTLKLEENIIIGWIGSFRRFHGLEQLIKGFYQVSRNHPQSRLLLIGDGSERRNIERLVEELGINDKVIFTGKKAFREVPKFIALFDIALVSANSSEGFHYSPLKLREYLAAGKAVLAPNAGEIPNLFKDGVQLKLFTVGDVENISKGMEFLLNNREKREEMGEAGREYLLRTGTWDQELEKCLDHIKNN